MNIYYHPNFSNAYKKLSLKIKEKAEQKEKIFRENPFDQRLDTHKLHGRLKNQWSFSINKAYRIVFEFYKRDVIFLDIGTHEIYQ